MKEKFSGVVLDGYTLNPGDLDWRPLQALCDLKVYDKTDASEVLARAENCELIFTNKVLITKEIMDALPKLKYVGVIATGYNVVDVDYARKKGIVVTNVPSYSSDSVAELAFAFILEFCFQVGKHSAEVHSEKWAKSEHFCYHSFSIRELRDKTLGIFGFGAIGKELAKIGRSFGMKVIFTNRSKKTCAELPEVKQVDLETLLSSSDFVSLNAPLNEETKSVINAKSLKLFKSSAYLINTARGALVNETDVAEALKAGKIAGYATDVLSEEPPKTTNLLFGVQNCIITPHIAWQTFEARTRLLKILADNAEAFIKGNVQNRVN